MAFDWQAFLDQRGIDYAERGPSTSRGNLYIHCPFCGDADQGRHMGVSIENKGWGCWRNQAHRGRSPQRLIQALLGCSWAEAAKLAGKRLGGSLWGADDAMGQMLAGFDRITEPRTKLQLPPDFRPLWHKSTPDFVIEYMQRRGYSDYGIRFLAERYDLHWAMTGPFAYRIIFPIRDDQGSRVTWTGRAIGQADIRYKTLTAHHDRSRPNKDPIAHGPITDYLLDLRAVNGGGDFLIICEGPFDVVNLYIGLRCWKPPMNFPARGLTAKFNVTCLFGKAVSEKQLDRLAAVRDKYQAMFLVLDPEASLDALKLSDTMATAGVHPFYLEGTHDPGEMTQGEMAGLFDAMAARVSSFAKAKGGA